MYMFDCLSQKAFKHAVHLEDTEALPWWTAALGKGARKHHGHGHGHGHIKAKHHQHEAEVGPITGCSANVHVIVSRALGPLGRLKPTVW